MLEGSGLPHRTLLPATASDEDSSDCDDVAPYLVQLDKGKGFRSEYHIVTNSCMMFAHKVNHAGGWSWFGPIPVWNSNPKAEMERGLLNNYITYNPRSDRFRESVWQISE